MRFQQRHRFQRIWLLVPCLCKVTCIAHSSKLKLGDMANSQWNQLLLQVVSRLYIRGTRESWHPRVRAVAGGEDESHVRRAVPTSTRGSVSQKVARSAQRRCRRCDKPASAHTTFRVQAAQLKNNHYTLFNFLLHVSRSLFHLLSTCGAYARKCHRALSSIGLWFGVWCFYECMDLPGTREIFMRLCAKEILKSVQQWQY